MKHALVDRFSLVCGLFKRYSCLKVIFDLCREKTGPVLPLYMKNGNRPPFIWVFYLLFPEEDGFQVFDDSRIGSEYGVGIDRRQIHQQDGKGHKTQNCFYHWLYSIVPEPEPD
jgi:hypothetical protein